MPVEIPRKVQEDTQLHRLVEKSSLSPFLNSLARDYQDQGRVKIVNGFLSINSKKGEVKIKIERESLLYFHRYFLDEIYLAGEKIDLKEMLEIILSEFSQDKVIYDFKSYFNNHLDNLRSIFDYHSSKITDHSNKFYQDNYIESEQSLLLGHPFHPYPKCRDGMTSEELAKYAPEHNGSFKFVWIEVPSDLFVCNLTKQNYLDEIKPLMVFDEISYQGDHYCLPLHPWQWDKLSNANDLNSLSIKKIGEGSREFSVLSSMRSYYHPEAPFQLKSSLDIKLTNSVRNLEYKEVKRAAKLYELVKALDLKTDQCLPQELDILFEPFFVGFTLSKESKLSSSSKTLVQFRETFKESSKEDSHLEQNSKQYLLSSLLELNPLTKRSDLDQILKDLPNPKNISFETIQNHWFQEFLNHVVAPLLQLACQKGVYLGAHMQNLIIKIRDGFPVGVTYRDCQGCAVSPQVAQKLESICDDSVVILDRDDLNKVFGYYFIVNTIFGTISQLAQSHHNYQDQKKVERYYLYEFRNLILSLKNKSTHSFYDYLLDSDFLWQKGNMRCSLEGINETTTNDPWSIYNKIANPLKLLRPSLSQSRSGMLYQFKSSSHHNITLRTLEMDDLDLFYNWHHKDYVKKFWELDKTKSELQDYIKKLKDSDFQLPIIVEVNGEAMAYFEIYWAIQDRIRPFCQPDEYDRGMHLLFGEEKYLKTRLVPEVIQGVSEFLFLDEPRTQNLWGEPRIDNSSILKLCQIIPGWRFMHPISFPHKEANLLKCEREDFFREKREVNKEVNFER